MNAQKLWLTALLISIANFSHMSLAMNDVDAAALNKQPHAKKIMSFRFGKKESKDQKLTAMSDMGYKPLGIKNSGNACYANSVMQLLMLMDDQYWFKGRDEYFPENIEGRLSSDQKFLGRVFIFRNSWQSGHATVDTNKRNLRNIIDSGIQNGVYVWGQRFGQEDATEFFQGISQFLGNTAYDAFMLQSSVQFMYEGQLKQESRLELIPSGIELSLPQHSETSVPFSQLFQGYFADEQLIKDNQFEYNGKKYDAIKFLRLEGNADYLFVSLKRFYIDERGYRRKISTKVDLDDGELSLDDAMVNRILLGNQFEIVGISMHSGSAYGGHYTARVKYGPNWYLVNDDVVKATDWRAVKEDAKTQGYLFLLKRK